MSMFRSTDTDRRVFVSRLKGACIIGQSGGPSAAINSSTYGVISEALKSEDITKVLAAEHGIVGVLNERLFDLGQEDEYELELLLNTPSSELGSCRYMLEKEEDFGKILEVFRKHDVRYFFYNGGNDSMDTCLKVSEFLAANNHECRVIGIPKTIDNDLVGTDHCPGFGSAAKYIATTFMEVRKDTVVYDTGAITVIEVMGRNAGWLTGSSALASKFGEGPDLVYLPEVAFDLKRFLDDINELYTKNGNVLIAASEGIHDEDGILISQYSMNADKVKKDMFGNVQLGGVASYLAHEIKLYTNAKVRGIELSLLQRCARHIASKTDLDEAYMTGKLAVESALAGESGKMVGIERRMVDGKYSAGYVLVPLAEAANFEKTVPLEWITPSLNNVTDEFIDYVLPLIQGEQECVLENSLPRYSRLRKVFV